MADDSVGNRPDQDVTVGPQGVGLDLRLPAGGPPEGQDRQCQSQEHGQDGTAQPFAPQAVAAVEDAQRQGGEDQHPQDVTDIPVPPGVGHARGVDHARQGQGADADGGRDHPRQDATQEQEADGVLLPLQRPPGATLPVPHQPGPGRGLQGGTDPDRQGDGQGGRAQGAAEPDMTHVE